MPKYLEKHTKSIQSYNTHSINFQVIAGRGKGKSTMVREILLLNNMTDPDSTYESLPESGSSETTKIQTPYKIKTMEKVYCYFFKTYIHVFLWDMPGLGGTKTP